MVRIFPSRVIVWQAVILRVAVALGLACLLSCQSPTSTNGVNSPSSSIGATRQSENSQATGPVRDLRQDEAAGGHILRKHVGQTEQQLRERIERERNITGASTYTDVATAENAVGAAIADSHAQIQSWLDRDGRHPNLVLDYDSPSPIGRTMNRGEIHSHVCSHALVVLKYVGPDNYYVLTSYPECR
jgi:hypothetical protein